jgi:predicted nucleic acid-binding protein
MRVYLDNVAASGRVLGDLAPASEMEALEEIERAHSTGRIKRVTSRESWREQERTKDPMKHAKLAAARAEVSVVATDHVVLGFGNLGGPYGTTVAYPLVSDIVDDALFSDLKRIGLRDADARHLMYAFVNACERFVTLDADFLDRRAALEARYYTLRIVRPSELVAELGSAPEGGQAS